MAGIVLGFVMTLLARAEHRYREGRAPSVNAALLFMVLRLLTFALAAAWTLRYMGPAPGIALVVAAILTRILLTRGSGARPSGGPTEAG